MTGYNNSAAALYCEPELTSVDKRSQTAVRQCGGKSGKRSYRGSRGSVRTTGFACEIVKRCTTDFRVGVREEKWTGLVWSVHFFLEYMIKWEAEVDAMGNHGKR